MTIPNGSFRLFLTILMFLLSISPLPLDFHLFHHLSVPSDVHLSLLSFSLHVSLNSAYTRILSPTPCVCSPLLPCMFTDTPAYVH